MKARVFSHKTFWYIAFTLLAAGLLLGFIPQADVAAQLIGDGDKPRDVTGGDFRNSVVSFINYFLTFLGLIAVVFVIYAGVLMVTSGGNEESTEKGKKILLWAGAGIIIILLSYSIVRLFIGAGDAVAV